MKLMLTYQSEMKRMRQGRKSNMSSQFNTKLNNYSAKNKDGISILSLTVFYEHKI